MSRDTTSPPPDDILGSEGAAVLKFGDQDSLDDQAARWVARLDSDESSEEILGQLRLWINQSPEHREALEGYLAIWDRMNLLSQLVPPRELKLADDNTAGRSPGVFTYVPWLAACAALLMVGFFNFWQPATREFSTATGEQQWVALEDGTTVLLNTNSHVRVAYNDRTRLIYLQRGEAHFEVAHFPDRPFEVYAGQGLVRAVGTAFSVYLRRDDVQVVVTEGTVEIDAVDAGVIHSAPAVARRSTESPLSGESAGGATSVNSKRSRVTAGKSAIYDRYTAKHVVIAEMEKIEEKLSWHQGLLVFDDEPLENVVAEVGRYTATKILIPELKIRQLKIGGQFKVGDTEAMFNALEVGFDIRADRVSDELVYLVSGNNE